MNSNSKFLSLILRHKPDLINLTMDSNGWVDVDELIDKAGKNGNFYTIEDLKYIVENNNKKRFSFNEDFTKIRANQGHSIDVDVELELVNIPESGMLLFHGTALENIESIKSVGLKPMNRKHVHLTNDKNTAINVGSRHSKNICLLEILISSEDSVYLSKNGVYLMDQVPPNKIKNIVIV